MSLKDALAGVREAQAEPVEAKPATARPRASSKATESQQIELEEHLKLTPTSEKPRGGRPMGKSRNPDYERMTVYVPSETRKKAERKWEDAGGGDLSDLAEHLLTKYLTA